MRAGPRALGCTGQGAEPPTGRPGSPSPPQAHGPPPARCGSRLSHPRLSRPRLFFWKLCSPPPRPEALTIFLASPVSAPFPPPAARRARVPYHRHPPPAPSGGTPAVPFPTVIPEGIPGPRIFPLATWGVGRSLALNFLQALDGVGGWGGTPHHHHHHSCNCGGGSPAFPESEQRGGLGTPLSDRGGAGSLGFVWLGRSVFPSSTIPSLPRDPRPPPTLRKSPSP